MSEFHSASQGRPAPAAWRAWWAVAVLTLAYVFSFVDRLAISVLVEPIKRDLGLSDVEIGLVQGLAFALFYSLMGVPLGRIADGAHRVRLIVGGIVVWSIATAGAGLATSFLALFVARVFVGAGEASLSPAAYSLFADLFPKHRLGRAIGVYTLGGVIGSGAGILVGSAVLEFYTHTDFAWPLVGRLSPWQSTLLTIGLPGLAIALLVLFTVREPPREAGSTPPTIGAVAAQVRARGAAYAAVFAAFTLTGVIGYGFVSWAPTFLVRRFEVAPSEAGGWFGGILLTAGLAGPLVAGVVGDLLTRRGRSDATLLVIAGCFACLLAGALVTFELDSVPATLAGMAVLAFGFTAALGLPHVAVQLLTPPRMRGQVTGLNLMVCNIVGIGIAPVLIPLAARIGFDGELGPAMRAVIGAAAALGLAVSLYGARVLVADSARTSTQPSPG